MQIFPAICSFRNPFHDDQRLSLPTSHEYIRNALVNPAHEFVSTPFCPKHRCRSTVEDVLSSNGSSFEEAYGADPGVSPDDVERSID